MELDRDDFKPLTESLERLRVNLAAFAKVFQEGGMTITAFNESWADLRTEEMQRLASLIGRVIHKTNGTYPQDANELSTPYPQGPDEPPPEP